MTRMPIDRRRFLAAGLAAPMLLAAATARAEEVAADGAVDGAEAEATASRNLAGFRVRDWQDHFETLNRGAILCDVDARVLHFWHRDGATTRVYPISVPLSEDLTRRGMTRITLKRPAPVWVPTPSMRERDPSLPQRVEAGPDNPLGTRAMNLSWTYYRIHGTHNPAKIGRRASDGCFGLFNHHVEELFDMVEVGTPVLVL